MMSEVYKSFDNYPEINRITLNKVFQRKNQIQGYKIRRK